MIRFQVGTAAGQPARVEVFDSAGRLAWSGDVQASTGVTTVSLHVEDLSTGIYFTRVSCGEASATRKLIVLRGRG
jgi:hypothetical protein